MYINRFKILCSLFTNLPSELIYLIYLQEQNLLIKDYEQNRNYWISIYQTKILQNSYHKIRLHLRLCEIENINGNFNLLRHHVTEMKRLIPNLYLVK